MALCNQLLKNQAAKNSDIKRDMVHLLNGFCILPQEKDLNIA